MKKIAILGPVFTKSYFGGVATFDENLAQGFKHLGYDVVLISKQKDAPRKTSNNIRIESPKILKKEKFEIAIMSLDYARYAKKINANKKAYFLHGFFSFAVHGAIKTIAALMFQKHYAKYCDKVISNSSFTCCINNLYGMKSSNVVHLGVSYDFIDSLKNIKKEKVNREPKSILYVGRINKTKGLDKVLEALKILKKTGKNDYSLTVIGDGDEKKNMEDYVIKNNLNVKFAGRVDQENLAKIYSSNELFVSMHPTESFGIAACEALLSGCKIICPRSGGQSEFLSDYPDRVKMLNDLGPCSIANAIVEITKMKTASKNISCGNFSFDEVAKKIEEIIINNSR